LDRMVKSTCRLCYNSCGVLIRVKGGKPISIEGDPTHPISRGVLCRKGLSSLEYLTSPHRLKHPLISKGERGQGKWEEVSWDKALEKLGEGLKRVEEKYSVLSIVFMRGASKGLTDDYFARFANLVGSPNISSPAPVCFQPGVKASQLTYGYYAYPDFGYPPKCIVLWGSNPAETLLPLHYEIISALEKGCKLIVVDPVPNEMTGKADVWIRPRPGTDLVVALAMIRFIIEENRYDKDFVANWTEGFDELRSHLLSFDIEEIENITWVSKDHILEAARLYTSNKPACIQWGNGIETTVNSFQACRAIAILRSITGNLGIPGGELKWSSPGGLAKGSPDFLCQNHIPPEVRERRLSSQDGLLPDVYYALPQTIVRAILENDPYPIRAGLVLGGNPLLSYSRADRVFEALRSLDFLAVADLFMTPTAMLADVILPAASYLEFDSVEMPWHIPIASVQQKVTEVGESWPDGKILNQLARKMGLERYVWEDMKDSLDDLLNPAGITFDEFRQIGTLVGTGLYRHYEREGFETKSRKVDLYSKTLLDWGFDPLPVYHEPPESPLSEPQMAEQYPFVLTSKKRDMYRHSGGRQIPSLRRARPDPVVQINRKTASSLGIGEGDWVYISTKRGRIRQKATLVERIDPRVIEVDYGWWYPEMGQEQFYGWREGNLNILTEDKPPYNREMGSTNLRGVLCKVYKA